MSHPSPVLLLFCFPSSPSPLSPLPFYFQELPTVTLHAPALATTVYALFAPLSQLTVPVLATWMNLYSKLVAGAKLIVTLHNGLLAVYALALSATADPEFQLPSAAMEPASLTVVPYVVVTSSLKVTAMLLQALAVVVVMVARVVVVVVGVGMVLLVPTMELTEEWQYNEDSLSDWRRRSVRRHTGESRADATPS